MRLVTQEKKVSSGLDENRGKSSRKCRCCQGIKINDPTGMYVDRFILADGHAHCVLLDNRYTLVDSLGWQNMKSRPSI